MPQRMTTKNHWESVYETAGGRLRLPEFVPRAYTLRPRAARQRAGAAHC
jgi:hypothetical protein